MRVPLFATSLDRHMPAIIERLADVARSGRYILGPEVEAFEREFAAYLGVRHCIGVANGTDALTIAFRALGVEPGDELVLPSLTFYATAEAAVNAGATPVFCDVDPETLCISADTVRPALTSRTKAIVAVHLFGRAAAIGPLRELGLPVVEDAAQAVGAASEGRMVGALGNAATFSFFPSKNLGCLGDGGAVTTDDDALAERARELRFHGSRDKLTFGSIGYNSRLDALQAGVLRLLLPLLDGWNEARRNVAAAYERAGLGDIVELPRSAVPGDHVYHLYVARHPRADELASALADHGIAARGYYRTPVHLQPGMRRFGGDSLRLPVTMEVARDNLALPMGPELSDAAVGEVVSACTAAGAHASA